MEGIFPLNHELRSATAVAIEKISGCGSALERAYIKQNKAGYLREVTPGLFFPKQKQICKPAHMNIDP